jgi:hypothetical protein
MTDREFRDNALIAVSASLASVQQPCLSEYDSSRGRTQLLPADEVASRAANIVSALIEQRKAMEAKRG